MIFCAIRAAYSSFVCVIGAWLLQRVRSQNMAIKMLEQAWQEWHGLTFHEKRLPVNFDRLVSQTEAAIMKQYEDNFQPSRGAATKSIAGNAPDDEFNGNAISEQDTHGRPK